MSQMVEAPGGNVPDSGRLRTTAVGRSATLQVDGRFAPLDGPRRAAASALPNAPFELAPEDVDALGTNVGKLRPDQGTDAAAARQWKRLKVDGASNC